MTKSTTSILAAALILTLGLSSCELVGDIFQAGMWFGVIGVILVVALIFWLIRKGRK